MSGKPLTVGEGFRDSFPSLKSCIKSYQLLVLSLFPLLLLFCYWAVLFVPWNTINFEPSKTPNFQFAENSDNVSFCWILSGLKLWSHWSKSSFATHVSGSRTLSLFSFIYIYFLILYSYLFLKALCDLQSALDMGKKVVMIMTNPRSVKALS